MNPREEFLKRVFLVNTMRDCLATRGGRSVYESMEGRKELRDTLGTALSELALQYYDSDVDDEQHIKNIRSLKTRVESKCGNLLNGGKFCFGIAQKALNIYLKYLWCSDARVRPPHCPFDNIVLKGLALPNGCEGSWTQCDSETDYRKWVSAARVKAQGQPLREWELKTYFDEQMRMER